MEPEGQSRGGGLGQSLVWVVEIEPVKPAQSTDSVAGLDQRAQLRDVVTGALKHLLLRQEARRRAGLAPGRPVLGIGHARGLAIFDAMMLCNLVLAIEEDDAILVGAHFKPPAEQRRRRGVAITAEVDETLHINDAALQCVHGGDIDGQRPQRGPLGGPKLDGAGLQVLAKLAVLALAPGARLGAQVVPVSEGAAREEIVLVVVKRPLDFARAIGVSQLVCDENETEALSKRFHLGRDGGVLAGPARDHHRRIVDHAASGGAAQKDERVGQEYLAPKAIPARVALQKAHARIAEDQRRRLHLAASATQFKLVRRGVVLHLHPGVEDVLARRLLHPHPNTQPPQSRRQRRIWDCDLSLG